MINLKMATLKESENPSVYDSKFFKNVRLLVTIDYFRKQITVCGCVDEDVEIFNNALLEMDKAFPVHGFETIEDVEKYWTDGDMLLKLPIDDFNLSDI